MHVYIYIYIHIYIYMYLHTYGIGFQFDLHIHFQFGYTYKQLCRMYQNQKNQFHLSIAYPVKHLEIIQRESVKSFAHIL